MNCLICHKSSAKEYHPKCLKELFGVEWIPAINFTIADLPAKVSQTAGRMSISGVQIKASVQLDEQARQLKIAPQGGTYILKPEPAEYPELPQNENLCMNLAAELKLNVPPHGLLKMADGKLCYVIKRFDRVADEKIHKEDLAQITGLPTDAKYSSSLEAVGKAIRDNTKNPYFELYEFFQRVVFNYVIGNGDMHLKNWSLLRPDSGTSLAPCYDFVCSKIYLPQEEDSALAINGKRNKLTRADFEKLAQTIGLESKPAANAMDSVRNLTSSRLASFLSAERQKLFDDIMRARIGVIESGKAV